jgi:hypothetical protein
MIGLSYGRGKNDGKKILAEIEESVLTGLANLGK